MRTTYELTSCPVCGSADAATVTDTAGMERERALLHEHHADVVAGDADRTDTTEFTHALPLRVARCTGCGLLYRSPRERYVRDMYEEEETSPATLERLSAAQRAPAAEAVERLTRLHGGTGTGLEIGPYSGAFLDAAAQIGWQFHAIDVNADVAEHLRGRGHDVAIGDITDAPELTYDVVAFWNCFEQLPDPLVALRATHARLGPGGLLALRVPNGDYYDTLRPHLDGTLRAAAAALLARHNWLGFPYRHGFTTASLEEALTRTGFCVLEQVSVAVLPVEGTRRALAALGDRMAAAFAGAPWIEVYARRK